MFSLCAETYGHSEFIEKLQYPLCGGDLVLSNVKLGKLRQSSLCEFHSASHPNSLPYCDISTNNLKP